MPAPRRLAVTTAERILPAALMRRARVAKFDRERRRFPTRVVEHDYGGVRRRVLIAAPYDERYDHDWPELQEVAWLKQRRLRPGARVFDIGASAGVVAMILADAVGPGGQVIALEAHPGDIPTIERNRELNGLDQIVPLHGAIAREPGELVFGRNGFVDDGSRRWGDLRVPSFSLDDLAERYGPPDVVFVDVEGYEHEALLGASATLEQGPDWFVEVHGDEQLGVYGASCRDVIELLRDAGYELFAAPDTRYVRLPDGRALPEHPIRPLELWPEQLLHRRFFLLATRRSR
jgi:FkbM family methyltransferase